MRGTHTKVVNWLVLQKRYSAITAQAFFCDLELSIPQHIFASSSTLRPLGSGSFCFFCTRPSHPWRGDRGYMVSIGNFDLFKSYFFVISRWSSSSNVFQFSRLGTSGFSWSPAATVGSTTDTRFLSFWQQTSSSSKPWCAVWLLNCTGTLLCDISLLLIF